MTAVDPHGLDTNRWLAALPFSQLLRIHLRLWAEQRSMIAGTALSLALGLLTTMIAGSTLSAPVTTASAGDQFVFSAQIYVMAWLAIGAFAGAAPFRSRWAALVLALAPRRSRWLAACYGSVLAWALAATVVFTMLAGIVTAIGLAQRGRPLGAAAGTMTSIWQLAIAVSIEVTVGFCLGVAAQATTVPLLTCYLALPLAVVWWGEAGRWIDLDAARNAISQVTPMPHDPAPMISALCLWLGGTVIAAAVRLRRSAIG